MDALLEHGDLVYVPGGMPHLAKNLQGNVGVSMNFLDIEHFGPPLGRRLPLDPCPTGCRVWRLGSRSARSPVPLLGSFSPPRDVHA